MATLIGVATMTSVSVSAETATLRVSIESGAFINVTLSVELGRTKMTIKDLMALNKGSIISMAKEVTEPMDLMVNGTLIARGDVVESEGQFGLRLLDIVSTDERLKPLQ